MAKTAFVFPGQGAQAVGMGKDAYDRTDAGKRIFDEADRVLGFELSKLIFEGPDNELKLTYNTQPALLAASLAYYEILSTQGLKADYVAGHSLGEYSALAAAGALNYADAVKIVRLRGEYMDKAVPAGKGAMAAVLGADRDALSALCRAVSGDGKIVELANVNCPGQIVVSGTADAVKETVERGKEAGAKRVIPLEVSGPFHSSLMRPAAEKLEETLAHTAIKDPAIPVVANVTASAVRSADEIRKLLVRQVVSPVLWEDSVRWMIAQGVDVFYEIGSGSVLSGLIKKIDRSVEIHTINSVDAALAAAEIRGA